MKKYHLLLFVLFCLSACQSGEETKAFRKDIVDAIFASGYLIADEQYFVTSTSEGYLQKSFVKEGDTVHKGQILFTLANEISQTQVQNAQENYRFALENSNSSAPAIQQILLQIAQAQEVARVDSVNYARYANLVKTNAVARADYEKAALAYQNSQNQVRILQKNLADLQRNAALQVANTQAQVSIESQNNQYYTLTSELDGQVLQIMKNNGELVRKGETLSEIGAGKLIIRLLVAEEDINRIQLGQIAFVALNTDKNATHKAKISRIYPAFDNKEQAFVVEALFVDSPKNLKSGTQLQANIIIAEKKNALLMPAQLLQRGDSVQIKGSGKKRR
ncbi:MAG: HlyD family efflux transporter periplasmic adaptor subunit [Microscillaceae bacterium]|nr:HlyD family efflux transporter periplasmic adaptor subunit [Microscillaceae bacterium]